MSKINFKEEGEQHNFWQNYTDLMSGFLIFGQGSASNASIFAVAIRAAEPIRDSISRPYAICVSAEVHHFRNSQEASRSSTVVDERFRLGECPIIISDYTLYNNLQVSAPDIKGLWGMAPVPGIVMEDGTINNAVGSTGQACVVMKSSKDLEASWEFLKWWTSADTQIAYGLKPELL